MKTTTHINRRQLLLGIALGSAAILIVTTALIRIRRPGSVEHRQLLSALQADLNAPKGEPAAIIDEKTDFPMYTTVRDVRFAGHVPRPGGARPGAAKVVLTSAIPMSRPRSLQRGQRWTHAGPSTTLASASPAPAPAEPPIAFEMFPSATTYMFGRNVSGQLGIGTATDVNVPSPLPSNGYGGPVAFGFDHMLTTDSEGRLWVSGLDSFGQFGDGSTTSSTPNITQMPFDKLDDVAAGNDHSLILFDDGKVMGTGKGSAGQLGTGMGVDTDLFSGMIDVGHVARISAQGNNSFIVTENGELWVCGENLYGQLGVGTVGLQEDTPTMVLDSGVVDIAPGLTHTLILMKDGSVRATGLNSYGQFGDGTTDSATTPVPVIPGGVKAVAAGNNFSLFLFDDGSLQSVGANGSGQLGTGDTATRNIRVTVANSVNAVAAGYDHALYIKNAGALMAMGSNTYGQLGLGDFSGRYSADTVVASGVTAVYAGANSSSYQAASIVSLEIRGNGFVYEGSKLNLECNAQFSDGRELNVNAEAVWTETSPVAMIQTNTGVLKVAPSSAGGVVQVTASYFGKTASKKIYIVELPKGSALAGFGYCAYSQLGLDTTVDQASIKPIDSSKVISMAGGLTHSIYVKEDGSVWAMGDNTYGQLGVGDTIPRTVPAQVFAGGALRVSCGDYHSLIIMQDGSLWSMGRNDEGQLGDGTQTDRKSPVMIEAVGVVQAVGGFGHSAFLTSEGRVYVTGRNLEGQLGDGTTSGTDYPQVVSAVMNVKMIAAGKYSTFFIDDYNDLYGTGSNAYGQLGLISSIVQVTTPTNLATSVKKVEAGAYHTLYVDQSGNLYATGQNTSGQLGDGTNVDKFGFISIAGMTNVEEIGAGSTTSYIVSNDEVYGTGSNTNGQFGDGTFISANTPKLLNWGAVGNAGFGGRHALIAQMAPVNLSVVGLNNAYAGKTANYRCFIEYDNGDYDDVTDSATWAEDQTFSSITQAGILTLDSGSEGQSVVVSATYNAFTDTEPVNVIEFAFNGRPLRSMGENITYQLGDDLDANSHSSPFVTDSTVVIAASAGYTHSGYVRSDGSLWLVGGNANGQLGTGDLTTRQTPVMIDTDVVKVACGKAHTMYVKADGSLWAMGDQTSGKLGNGQVSGAQTTPTPIRFAGVIDVAVGDNHTLFIEAGGKLFAMGDNASGQLGLPHNGQFDINSTRPELVVDGGVTAIAAGSAHSLFVQNGALMGMGDDYSGQLGLGGNASYDWPNVIIGSNIKDCAAGEYHSLVVTDTAVLLGMGYNLGGQLGLGYASNAVNAPVVVDTSVSTVAAGTGHSLWIRTDSSLWGAGENADGQLGLGFVSSMELNPRMILPNGAEIISAGNLHSLFTGANLTGVTITGPATLNETDTAAYTCTASWDDATTTDVSSSAAWSIDNYGTFATNVLTADSVTTSQAAEITATFSTFSDTHSITVVDVPKIVNIAITGLSSMNEADTSAYTCTAYWDDSSTTDVSTAAGWSIDNYGTFAANVLTTDTIVGDQSATITATYSTFTDTHPLSIVDNPKIVSITVAGPTSVNESDTAAYTCTATWDNLSTTDVTSSTGWSINGFGTFAANVLTAGAVTTDEAAVITGTYSTFTDTHAITVVDVPTIVSIAITGPASVNQEATATYTCTATWSDASTSDVSSSVTWAIDNYGSFTANVLTGGDVTADQSATITATLGALTDTHAVTIVDVPVIVTIAIAGPVSVNESSTQSYTCIGTYDNGTTASVTATWALTSTYASVVAGTGVVTTNAVTGDWPVTLTATHGALTENLGITVLDGDPLAMIYVDAGASGGVNNGTSWANAFTELYHAFPKASAGSEIWVAGGTYKPTATANRTISFSIPANVNLYGGFAGTETARTDRAPVVNLTILSGDIGTTGLALDNSFNVVETLGPAVIDGFIIRDGNANSGTTPAADGTPQEDPIPLEAHEMAEMSPIAADVVYYRATEVGGGLLNVNNSGVSVTNCRFMNNRALYGGGAVYNRNGSTSYTGCTFSGNSANKWGGAMFNTDSASVTITACTFNANHANVAGGAMMNSISSSPAVTRSQFIQNTAGRDGGAAISNYSAITFSNCLFRGNSAGKHGGALLFNDSTPTLIHCTLSSNTAGKSGGGIECNDSTVTITNSILWLNSAPSINEVHPRFGSIINISYSCINDTNFTGTGLIYTDPQFANPALGDLKLQLGSPCIDAGTVTSVVVDIDNGARDSTPDMGAYEYGTTPGSGAGGGGDIGGGDIGAGGTGTTAGGGGGGCAMGAPSGSAPVWLLLLAIGALYHRRRLLRAH